MLNSKNKRGINFNDNDKNFLSSLVKKQEVIKEPTISIRTINGAGFVSTVNELTKISKALLGPQKYDGEKHVIMRDKNGNYIRANYAGPNTNLKQRLKDGDEPVSITDKVAQAHDIRYSMALNEDDRRNADKKMIDRLELAKKNKEDADFNINPSLYGIKGKILLEDKLKVPRNAFADIGYSPNTTDEDKQRYRDRLSVLEQEGFGSKHSTKRQGEIVDSYKYQVEDPETYKPAQRLLKTLIKKTKKERLINRNTPKAVKKIKEQANIIDKELKKQYIPNNVKEAIMGMSF